MGSDRWAFLVGTIIAFGALAVLSAELCVWGGERSSYVRDLG